MGVKAMNCRSQPRREPQACLAHGYYSHGELLHACLHAEIENTPDVQAEQPEPDMAKSNISFAAPVSACLYSRYAEYLRLKAVTR